MKQQQEMNEKGMISSFLEMNKMVNKNQTTIVGGTQTTAVTGN
jgi:hypothetical protein